MPMDIDMEPANVAAQRGRPTWPNRLRIEHIVPTNFIWYEGPIDVHDTTERDCPALILYVNPHPHSFFTLLYLDTMETFNHPVDPMYDGTRGQNSTATDMQHRAAMRATSRETAIGYVQNRLSEHYKACNTKQGDARTEHKALEHYLTEAQSFGLID